MTTLDDDHAMLETLRLSRMGLTYQPKRHGAPPKGCNPRGWGAGMKGKPVYASDGRWWLGLNRAGRALGVSHGRVAQVMGEASGIGGVRVSRKRFRGVKYGEQASP